MLQEKVWTIFRPATTQSRPRLMYGCASAQFRKKGLPVLDRKKKQGRVISRGTDIVQLAFENMDFHFWAAQTKKKVKANTS